MINLADNSNQKPNEELKTLSSLVDLMKGNTVNINLNINSNNVTTTTTQSTVVTNNSDNTNSEELKKLNASVNFLSLVKVKLDSAIQHLDSLSADEAYQRIGQVLQAMGKENTQLIEDKRILQESVVGAWELVQTEIEKQELEIEILNQVLLALDYSFVSQDEQKKEITRD